MRTTDHRKFRLEELGKHAPKKMVKCLNVIIIAQIKHPDYYYSIATEVASYSVPFDFWTFLLAAYHFLVAIIGEDKDGWIYVFVAL